MRTSLVVSLDGQRVIETELEANQPIDLDAEVPEEALEGCDVAMALRQQLERQNAGFVPSIREYHDLFGIKLKHLEQHPDLRIMHPGPVNRGVELASEVVDHERAIILNQVKRGHILFNRMCPLFLLSFKHPGFLIRWLPLSAF